MGTHLRRAVLPVFFAGQNSRMYQVAAKLNQTPILLLTSWNSSESFSARIDVSLGDVVSAAKLSSVCDPAAATAFLKQATWDARLAGP
jgi:hypothetical protein